MTSKSIDVKNYCDSLYSDLYEIKAKISKYAEQVENLPLAGREDLHPYIKHLHEIENFLDWKMEIFAKVCPVDWGKFIEGIEDTVSVPDLGIFNENEVIAAGSVGG